MRLFVALPVPAAVRERLGRAQELLKSELEGAEIRWSPPASSHLTLRFLGEVAERELPGCRLAVTEAARRATPFELATGGFGAFPTPRRPSVLWLGVGGEVAELERLQGWVAAGLDHLAKAPAGETFRPHLTLGRVKRMGGRARERFAELLAQPPEAAAWRVASMNLMASELRPGGSGYTVILEAPLGG